MRQGIRAWLVAWCGWTALALFFATSTSLTYRSTGRPGRWSLTIGRALAEWWLWALLTPAIVWLARRYPLHGHRRWRHLGIHLAVGVVVAVAKTSADRAVYAMLTGFWFYWLASTLALQFFVYGAVVAVAHGLEYYRRSREREQIEARLAATRLQLLSMQLQPHFLFNTLNTIAELVHEDPESADRMITGLSDLLRRTLELGAVQEIPLEEEVSLLSQYLDIQKARFGERLAVSIRVSDDVRRAPVPVLLLQPLVENAIRHGLTTASRAGRVIVDARQERAILAIDIINVTGHAAEPVSSAAVVTRERVGLGNTRERLEALYGHESHLELVPLPGGARVSLRIPFRSGAPA
jgi:hypothetical protein